MAHCNWVHWAKQEANDRHRYGIPNEGWGKPDHKFKAGKDERVRMYANE